MHIVVDTEVGEGYVLTNTTREVEMASIGKSVLAALLGVFLAVSGTAAPATAVIQLDDDCAGKFTGMQLINNRLEWGAEYGCESYPTVPTLRIEVELQKYSSVGGVSKFRTIRVATDGPRVTAKVVAGAATWCDNTNIKRYRQLVTAHKDGVQVVSETSSELAVLCGIQ